MAEYTDKSKVFFYTAVMTVSIFLEKVLFLAINIIIARYLDVAQYGEYTTALALASFFALFTDMGINEAMIREINYETEKDDTLYNIILLKISLSVLLFVPFYISSISTGYTDEVIYLTLIFGFVRFGGEYLVLYYTYYEAKNQFLASALYRLIFAILFLVSVFVAILDKGGNVEIAWFRFVIVLFFILLLTGIVLKRRKKKVNCSFMKSFIRKALPFASSFISGNIIYQGNLVILPLLHGTLSAGIFQNAYMFITALMFIPASFGRVFIPYLYKQDRENDILKFQFAYNILTKSFVFISFFITVILFLYSDFFIINIFGGKYSDSITVLRIISLSLPFAFNASIIILTASDMQKIYSIRLKHVAVISIILNIILGYLLKINGIAIATVLTFLLMFFMANSLVKKHIKLSVSQSIIIYAKAVIIFLLCWFVRDIIKIEYEILSMLVISVVFCLLSLLLIFNRNDMRIAREIMGKD